MLSLWVIEFPSSLDAYEILHWRMRPSFDPALFSLRSSAVKALSIFLYKFTLSLSSVTNTLLALQLLWRPWRLYLLVAHAKRVSNVFRVYPEPST